MLEEIASGKDGVSFVLVFKLSRFGRNAADVLSSLQLMQDYGVNLICVEDGIDSSKEAGKLMISVLSAVAEIERENILVQTMEGRRQKAREGRWNGGFAPYGYKLVDGDLQIAEDEAEIIRIIFDKYIHTNMGVNGVADYLNTHGYKKKKRQNNTLDAFASSFIKGVLDNPIYIGKMPYGRRSNEKIQGTRNEYHVVKQDEYDLYDGIHEAIISEDDFRLAAQKRKETGVKREKTHSLEHEHILSGILRCPVCHGAMYSNVNRKKKSDGTYYKDFFYYACKHRLKVDGHNCSYHHQWGQDKVNAAVEEVIYKLVNNPKFQDALKTKVGAKTDTEELEKEREICRTRLRQTIGAKNKLADQMDALDVCDKFYDRKYDDMQERMNKLYEEIGAIEDEIDTISMRIDNINKKQLSKDSITVPPIDEQHKIAAVLDKVSDLIVKRQQQLDKLDEAVKARFVEIFGEPDENPKHWQEDELSHHLKVIGGYAFKSDGFTDEGIPVLRIGNINSGHFLPVNMVYWPDDLALARYKVFPGDLVMSLTRTVGKDDYGNVCILGADYDEYYLNQRNAKLSIEKSLNKCYFSELLKFPRIKKRLTGISRGIRQANISNKDILSLRVPMPPIELQEQFAAFMEQTEKTKIIISHSLEKLETLKKALMQEYFG